MSQGFRPTPVLVSRVMASTSPPASGSLDRFFRISERGSSIRTEVIAGLVTFATMAYILFVNPAVLGALEDSAGVQLQFGQVLTVTALAAAIGTIAMGIVGNVPFAIAAGLGLNAFVAFGLVGAQGLTWPAAMGVMVVEGLIIALLVIVGLREKIMLAFPDGLRRAIGAGIGAFIAIIGLHDAGIVLSAPEGDSRVSIITATSSVSFLVPPVAALSVVICLLNSAVALASLYIGRTLSRRR